MRSLRLQNASIATLFASSLIAFSHFAAANPYPRLASQPSATEIADVLEARQCANPCGYYGQVCCKSDQYCYTDSNNQAQCGDGAAPGTKPAAGGATVTVAAGTVTVYAGSTPVAATCNAQSPCPVGMFCNSGVCLSNAATTSGGIPAAATVTVSPAIRPTSITTYTVMTTNGATTTVPFLMPATATASGGFNATAQSTSGSSLSGGAIAGIVIGVLAGIIILILLIICCCARGLLDLFRPKRKTEVTEVYESHHHSGGARPGRRFGIFGGGGNDRPSDGKKGWAGVAGILAAVALILGLKRRHDRKEEEKMSSAYTYSDYTYDYSTSASSESSDDRRTRVTRSDRRSSSRRG